MQKEEVKSLAHVLMVVESKL